ncbi:MAG: hypothetical protein WC856_16805 [Methylococcaceae bacterium]
MIIVWPIPKKRGVFGRSKVPRGRIESYAGQNESPGHPILAHLSGVQAATEQMKAPVTHARDGVCNPIPHVLCASCAQATRKPCGRGNMSRLAEEVTN